MNKKQIVGIAIMLIVSVFSMMCLCSCKTADGKTIRWTPYASNKSSSKATSSKATETKITQNNSKGCEGIVITDTGRGMFRGAVPYVYVSVKNNSEIRKEITLDIKWRSKGKNYFGAYNDSTWTVFGPQPLRPGEEANFVVKKAPKGNLTLEEVALAKCE
ncbi:MAG: hypothetical protein H8E00_00525 [Deltaproteobacteria bacterium]|nr:hypothetical protein [Deltaproteobacteria bacterium]